MLMTPASEARMYISLSALIAIGWVTYCLVPTIDEWISDRRENKDIDRQNKEFEKSHHYDERQQRWVRNVDGAILCDGGDGETYYRSGVR
jgi:hypothetical protein